MTDIGFDKKGFSFALKFFGFLVFLIFFAKFSTPLVFNSFFKEEPNLQVLNKIEKDSPITPIKQFVAPRLINNHYSFENIAASRGKAIGIDLVSMKLTLYQDGQALKTYPILTKGREGSLWETPSGAYSILLKEDNHFSSIGEVWMPYSMQFYGNFFIHGWPYYPGGAPVPQGYSGGCIRLATKDAEEIYQFAEIGAPVFIYEENESLRSLASESIELQNIKSPEVKAKSFLVADLESGLVFLEKDASSAFPVASLTKLMTAVTAHEAMYLGRFTTINQSVLETYGDAGNLKLGETFKLYDLIFPLLMESSNDAAKALALAVYGEEKFVSLMNEKASALGMKNAFFVDPSGIGSSNVSTAEDLFRLARYISDKRSFLFEITKTPSKEIFSEDGNRHIFQNYNIFDAGAEFIGGKTGYTKDALGTRISIFSLPVDNIERDIAIIVLGSEEREKDTKALLEWFKQVSVSGESAEAKIAFVGDVMLARGVRSVIENYGRGDFRFPFLKIGGNLQNYDLLFGNLEGAISDQGENLGSAYSFRMEPKAIDGLKYAGFNVLSVANNHIGDWGADAMKDTFKRLSEAGIFYVGGGFDKEEPYEPRIIEVNGMKIAFLGFSQFGKNYLESGGINKSGIAVIDEEKIGTAVKKARAEADIVVVSFHWGEEYQAEPNEYQKRIGHLAIDAGADLVIGHHPHVIQPIEKYKDSYIAYSLGNFVFDQNFSEETTKGLLLEAVISGGKIASLNPLEIKISENFQPFLK